MEAGTAGFKRGRAVDGSDVGSIREWRCGLAVALQIAGIGHRDIGDVRAFLGFDDRLDQVVRRQAAELDQLLQPAEHLWQLVDEPVVNQHFETLDALDAVLAERCRTLEQDRDLIAANTTFHWWPKSDAAA